MIESIIYTTKRHPWICWPIIVLAFLWLFCYVFNTCFEIATKLGLR